MKKQMKPPIRPSNKRDPTGLSQLERGAIKEFEERVKKIVKSYISLLNQIPVSPIINKKYLFELDQNLIERILQSGALIVDDILFSGELNNWFFQKYVKTAYERGTAQEYTNLSQQSSIYSSYTQSLQNVILSEPYQLRMLLVRARIFEGMKNLSSGIKTDMARILTDGVGRGLNPREIARNLVNQSGIIRSRANKVARTEVPNALRQARLDESNESKATLNLKTAQVHISSLSPTTRITHAARHGKIYTEEEQRDFWATDGNAINCTCSTVTILLGDDGKPLNNNFITKLREEYKQVQKEYKNFEG